MFAQLDLNPRLLKALEACGFQEATPVQLESIPLALAGRDLRVTAQTGTGKTAAYLLPTLQRLLAVDGAVEKTRALVLVPTRELAEQVATQVERFASFTFLRVGLVIGGVDFRVQAAKLRKLPDVVVGTPGRLLEQLDAGNLDFSGLQVLVLDEADRMLDMGFAEDVMRLVSACPAERQTLLYSATTGGGALREVVANVLRDPIHLQLNQKRELNPAVRHEFLTADDSAHKEQLVTWLLAHEQYRKAIIFTNTRTQADRLCGVLVAQQHRVFVLHGDKDQRDRARALERLRQGAVNVLVATDVAARGLDVDGLDLVINFDLPRSGDDYVHRIGRTGRAGEGGQAITMVCQPEWNLMSSIERYLKLRFERRSIKELRGKFQGPKKLKASGKAAGPSKKKSERKTDSAKAARTPSARAPKPARRGSAPAANGSEPIRRKPRPAG